MTKTEYLDVLDEQGNFSGKKKLRADIHKDGDWHRAIHAWIINPRGELLLQRRAKSKETNPNMLDISVAGHIEAGQTSLETVLKEAQEELGITLSETEPEYLFSYQREVRLNGGKFINRGFHDVYLIEKDLALDQVKIDPKEVAELIYLPWKNVREELRSGNPEFLQHPDEFPKLFETLEQRY